MQNKHLQKSGTTPAPMISLCFLNNGPTARQFESLFRHRVQARFAFEEAGQTSIRNGPR
jgi:hypothetical protein